MPDTQVEHGLELPGDVAGFRAPRPFRGAEAGAVLGLPGMDDTCRTSRSFGAWANEPSA